MVIAGAPHSKMDNALHLQGILQCMRGIGKQAG